MNTRPEINPTTLADIGHLRLAADAGCAVLIRAAAEEAVDAARAIAVQLGLGAGLHVCDFGRTGRSWSSAPTVPDTSSVVLLCEVQGLTATQQAWLMKMLDDAERGESRPRIIASSSVCLFHRVKEGLFDARLYYRLNAVRLVVSNGEVTE